MASAHRVGSDSMLDRRLRLSWKRSVGLLDVPPRTRPDGRRDLIAPLCVIPEGAGPVKSGFLFVIFLLAALRLLLGAPG